MPIIASHVWWPSLNPIGAWSATAAMISATTWFVVDRRFLRNARAQGWLTVAAPLLLLAFVFHSKVHADLSPLGLSYGWLSWRWHPPNAQDYFADYIFVAVALILAWKAARLPSRDLKVLGFIELAVTCGFAFFEVISLYRDLYAAWRD